MLIPGAFAVLLSGSGFDSWQSFFALVGQIAAALAALGSIYRFAIKPMIKTYKRISDMYERVEKLVKEMERNGGSSIRDSLDRIEKSVALIDERQKILLGLVPYGIVETDGKGRVIYANRTYLHWTGRAEPEVIGDGWSNSVHPNDRERIRHEWMEAVKERRAYEGRFLMLDGHGKGFMVSAKAVPMLPDAYTTLKDTDPVPQPIGWLAIIQRCDFEDCPREGSCILAANGSELCNMKKHRPGVSPGLPEASEEA